MEDYTVDSVDLTWTPPASDGGAQITQYIIQKKPITRERWENCGVHKTPTGEEPLKCKIDGLEEKQKLQFRVIAVNKAGESVPSEPSDVHLVKHKKR